MQTEQYGERVVSLLRESFDVFEEKSERLIENGGEDVQRLSGALSQHEEVAREQIFATTIVNDRVLMTSEERLVWIPVE